MYIIKCERTPDGLEVKDHSANTIEMAQAIVDDMAGRFNAKATIQEKPDIAPTYDPGGAMFVNQSYIDLGLVRVNEQHSEYLKQHLGQLLTTPPREGSAGRYYKLHGHITAVCLSHSEAHTAFALLTIG